MALLCCRQTLQQLKRTHFYRCSCLHFARPAFREFSSSSQSSKDEEKPLSYLRSKAAQYNMFEAERNEWKRREWIYKYVVMPLSTVAFFGIVYLIFFSKETELTEEQLERLQSIFDDIEARKQARSCSKTDSNKPST